MLPEIFLGFLAKNGIDPEIYTGEVITTPRFLSVRPDDPVSVDELNDDFASGVEFVDSPYVKGFYRLLSPLPSNPMTSSTLFRHGRIIAMDLTSGMAVGLLDLAPGDHVLDLCCAPGTKLTLAALMVSPEGTVTGVDISRQRLASARSLAKKYRLGNVRLFCQDGRIFSAPPFAPNRRERKGQPMTEAPFYASSSFRKSLGAYLDDGLYDKVLVDAQCTHDGSVKHVQKCMKGGWGPAELNQYSPENLNALYQLQSNLLGQGFRLLKPGGTLIYSTCSMSRDQNEEIVGQFLSAYPSAKSIPIQEGPSPYLRIHPQDTLGGGFFIAKLTKIVCKD